jgi:hypothetical protein
MRDLAGMLEQTVEQEATGARASPVEPEGELVEVVRELRDGDRALVSRVRPRRFHREVR